MQTVETAFKQFQSDLYLQAMLEVREHQWRFMQMLSLLFVEYSA